MPRRKVIAFDLDGTLAPSKSPLPKRVGDALHQLLGDYHVCVISGGKFGQFEKQLLEGLQTSHDRLERLHLMPTSGTRYYRYDRGNTAWQTVYAEDIDPADRQRIISTVLDVVKELGYEEPQTWGETIEDRGSQITWSALGQDIVAHLGEEGVRRKEEWDPDAAKKQHIREAVSARLPEFEVRAGGASSVDITRPGIDKAYGIQKLMALLGVDKHEILFIGDRLIPGGNDYPVKAMGVDTIPIRGWEETALVIETILHTTKSTE